MGEVGVIMLWFQRGFERGFFVLSLLLVVLVLVLVLSGEAIHSAKAGFIFQSTVGILMGFC